MDNRTDATEDLQSTPEHAANEAPMSGPRQQQTASQLTAGPHNDPPQSQGPDDTYQPPSDSAHSRNTAWQSLQQTFNRYPLQLTLGLVGLGLTVALLARRRAR